MDRDEEVREIDEAIALVKGSFEDWYCVERVEHDGRTWMEPTNYGARFMVSARISDADVEGTSEDMKAIAQAIKDRGSYSAKRCAVNVREDRAQFWSPRNSRVLASVPLAVADALAEQIQKELG